MLPSDILLIDKPSGITSHDVVDDVRRVFHTRRVGHAGTLDPCATGLLIIGINAGTKKLTALVGLDKTYEATLLLGATSTTFDRDGTITINSTTDSKPSLETIERVLDRFRGGYDQRAPLYSAKKIHGKKLYELARAGCATEEMRPTKSVRITELRIIRYAYPELDVIVTCSSGTYIRSLADDIGRALDIGAYLFALRRTRVGPYRLQDAVALTAIGSVSQTR